MGSAMRPTCWSCSVPAWAAPDIGRGGGLYFGTLAAAGRTVVGLDRSADQLSIARGRSRQVVQGDAAALPFADGTFPTVTTSGSRPTSTTSAPRSPRRRGF